MMRIYWIILCLLLALSMPKAMARAENKTESLAGNKFALNNSTSNVGDSKSISAKQGAKKSSKENIQKLANEIKDYVNKFETYMRLKEQIAGLKKQMTDRPKDPKLASKLSILSTQAKFIKEYLDVNLGKVKKVRSKTKALHINIDNTVEMLLNNDAVRTDINKDKSLNESKSGKNVNKTKKIPLKLGTNLNESELLDSEIRDMEKKMKNHKGPMKPEIAKLASHTVKTVDKVILEVEKMLASKASKETQPKTSTAKTALPMTIKKSKKTAKITKKAIKEKALFDDKKLHTTKAQKNKTKKSVKTSPKKKHSKKKYLINHSIKSIDSILLNVSKMFPSNNQTENDSLVLSYNPQNKTKIAIDAKRSIKKIDKVLENLDKLFPKKKDTTNLTTLLSMRQQKHNQTEISALASKTVNKIDKALADLQKLLAPAPAKSKKETSKKRVQSALSPKKAKVVKPKSKINKKFDKFEKKINSTISDIEKYLVQKKAAKANTTNNDEDDDSDESYELEKDKNVPLKNQLKMVKTFLKKMNKFTKKTKKFLKKVSATNKKKKSADKKAEKKKAEKKLWKKMLRKMVKNAGKDTVYIPPIAPGFNITSANTTSGEILRRIIRKKIIPLKKKKLVSYFKKPTKKITFKKIKPKKYRYGKCDGLCRKVHEAREKLKAVKRKTCKSLSDNHGNLSPAVQREFDHVGALVKDVLRMAKQITDKIVKPYQAERQRIHTLKKLHKQYYDSIKAAKQAKRKLIHHCGKGAIKSQSKKEKKLRNDIAKLQNDLLRSRQQIVVLSRNLAAARTKKT